MLEPHGQGGVSRTADGATTAGFGRRWPEAGGGKSRRTVGWGGYPIWVGVLTVLAAALLGAAFTVATHRDPGRPLGIFLVVGTLAAGTSVRARSAYVMIPVPALAYVVAAAIAGYVHDRTIDTSRTALTLSGVQWIANGFIAMTAATALAVVLAIARWLLERHYAQSRRQGTTTARATGID
jgi:hypothetical protein